MRTPCYRTLITSLAALAMGWAIGDLRGQAGLRVERHFELIRGDSTALAWSPTGDRLAIGGMLGDLVVVDADGGKPARLRPSSGDYADTVAHLCWSTDAGRLVVSTRSGIELLDFERRKVLAARTDMTGPVIRLVGSGDYVGIGKDGNPRRLAGATLEPLATIQLPPGGPATRLAMSPDGQRLAVATSRPCQLFVFDVATGKRLETIAHDPGAVSGLSWPSHSSQPWWLAGRDLHAFGATGRFWGHAMITGPTGLRVAVQRNDGWNVIDQAGKASSLGRGLGLLALHPDGERWARAFDGGIDFGRGTEVVHSIDAPVALTNFHHGSLAGGGRFVVLQGYRDALSVFDRIDGAPVSVAGVPQPGRLLRSDYGSELVWATRDQVTWWSFDADGGLSEQARIPNTLLPEVVAGVARLHGRWLSQSWLLVDTRGELQRPWKAQPTLSSGGAISVRGGAVRWVVFTRQRLQFLDSEGEGMRTLLCPGGVIDVVVSPSRSRLAVVGLHDVRAIDIATGETRLVCEYERSLRHARWCDEDRILVTGAAGRGGFAALRSANTGKELGRIVFRCAVQLLDLAPEAKRALVSTTGRATVIRWD